MKNTIENSCADGLEKVAYLLKKTNIINKEKISKKSAVACILAYCGWPLCFYMGFVYFNTFLKNTFGYSNEDIIQHNFCLAFFPLTSNIVLAQLSQKFAPLKILKIKATLLFIFVLTLPYLIISAKNPIQIFAIQSFILAFSLDTVPAASIFISNFPIFKRFTTITFSYAFSRALMYVITSFSLIFIIEIFGYYGLWLIMMPVIVAHLWGVNHFQKLENKSYAL